MAAGPSWQAGSWTGTPALPAAPPRLPSISANAGRMHTACLSNTLLAVGLVGAWSRGRASLCALGTEGGCWRGPGAAVWRPGPCFYSWRAAVWALLLAGLRGGSQAGLGARCSLGKGRAALLQRSNTRPVLLAVGLLTSASWAELFPRSLQVRRAAWLRENTLHFSVALNSLRASCRSVITGT